MTDAENNAATTPFWRFSLNFYRQAGVSDACIALQDGRGVDVNLLLFLFWLASEGRQLSADDVKKLDDQVRDWRNLTIVPIRDARRKLKGAATLVEPGKQEVFRNKVKAVELEAERLQQEALYDFTKSGPLGTPASPAAAARANMAAYERALGASLPKGAVDLLTGAFDGLAS
ncbi:MAG: TIGR02444 family protein [Xanthobacteraceae bacterium]